MSFLRHTEIYQSDNKQRRVRPASHTLAHRLDESPGRLFLEGLLSSIALLRFTGRPYCATIHHPWQSLLCQALSISLTTGLTLGAHPTFEEGVQAAWLYDVIKPLVAELIVCNPRENRLMHTGNKSDKVDAHNLADLLRLGRLKSVYHGDGRTRDLKERVRSYDGLSRDCMRVMNRIKAIYRGRGINCKGTAVYREGVREEWVKKVKDPGATDRLDLLYKELDCLSGLRKEARKGLVKEVRRQSAFKVLMQVPTPEDCMSNTAR